MLCTHAIQSKGATLITAANKVGHVHLPTKFMLDKKLHMYMGTV